MNKKLTTIGVGIALLFVPLLVSAQATSSSNSSIIASLEALVATLTQELQQLIASRGTTSSANMQLSTTATSSLTTIDQSSLRATTLTPTISGTASNMSQVGIFVAVQTPATFTGWTDLWSDDTPVVNGKWSYVFPSGAFTEQGNYKVSIYNGDTNNDTALASGNLIIGGSCATYADLSKGATDASTNGEISQLQSFLGMSNITGYYGAQTSIAYQNKCGNLGNAQPTYVAGMSQYTDSSFGFSFWYPSTWTVHRVTTSAPAYYGDDPNQALPTLSISSGSGSILLTEISSKTGVNQLCTGCADSISFDAASGQWTESEVSEGGTMTDTPLDTSHNTMGGLHLLNGFVIPLSASKFVVSQSNGLDATALLNTIVATNPAVAVPVSTAQQTATIQAEASAYGANVSASTNTSAGFTASPTSGRAPLTVSFTPGYATTVDFGDGATGCSVSMDSMNCFVPSSFAHTYKTPGTYTVTFGNLTPARTIGTATITVTQ